MATATGSASDSTTVTSSLAVSTAAALDSLAVVFSSSAATPDPYPGTVSTPAVSVPSAAAPVSFSHYFTSSAAAAVVPVSDTSCITSVSDSVFTAAAVTFVSLDSSAAPDAPATAPDIVDIFTADDAAPVYVSAAADSGVFAADSSPPSDTSSCASPTATSTDYTPASPAAATTTAEAECFLCVSSYLLL